VTLTSPTDGARFASPAKMTLAATASDSDGTVIRVEFFNGTTRLGEDTTAPFTHPWNIGAAGTYTLISRATDNAGGTASASVTITVVKKR
jgi:chitinase